MLEAKTLTETLTPEVKPGEWRTVGRPLFHCREVQAVRLDESDLPELRALNERCADYTQLVAGTPPDPADAEAFLKDLPDGSSREDKFALGLFKGRRLIGVMDAIRNYPEVGTWFLGLMMLEPASRRQGLGRALEYAFEAWVRNLGGRRIVMSVPVENRGALSFWWRLGYKILRGLPPQPFGCKIHARLLLQRDLGDRLKVEISGRSSPS